MGPESGARAPETPSFSYRRAAISVSWDNAEPDPEPPLREPCPRCAPLEGQPGPQEWEGTPCPTCGRALPLPAGLPGGTVLTILLSLKLLGQSIQDAWETARSVIEDEQLRTNLLAAAEPDTPDAYISLNQAEVTDPLTPAVLHVMEEERAHGSVGMRRLLYGLRHRKAILTVILREAFGAGFQRDEARVAARLGFPLNTVRLAVRNKNLVRV